MRLVTRRLILRPPAPEDLDPMSKVFGDSEVMRYIGDGATLSLERVESALARSRKSIEETGLGAFIIIDKETGDVCGDCVLQQIAHSGTGWKESGVRGPDVEIGFRLARAWWNRGIATDAGARMIEYGFDSNGASLERIVAVTQPENRASQRVLEKIGMHRQGSTDCYYDQTCAFFELLKPAHDTS